MILKTFCGGYDNNFCYLTSNGKNCVVIDPSVNSKIIFNHIKENNLKLNFVVIMHSHFDHLVDINVYNDFNIPVYAHESIKDYDKNINVDFKIDKYLKDEEKIFLKNSESSKKIIEIKVMHTPGHRFDCICLLIEESNGKKSIFTSDTLFVSGCGRVDSPGSDKKVMYDTLKKLKQLPKDVIVYPGHNYGKTKTSTIGSEKINNPYLKMDKETFLNLR